VEDKLERLVVDILRQLVVGNLRQRLELELVALVWGPQTRRCS
jgi:hypothetical protein